MGPHVRHWLGVSDVNYRGHSRGRANDEEIASFAREVSARLEELPFESEKQFLDVTMELFSMDLSLLNLKLFDHYRDSWLPADFHREQLEAVSALSVGELSRAWRSSITAHKLNPEEPAPYVNLSQILLQWGENIRAKEWCESGLLKFPEHRPLWQALASVFSVLYKNRDDLLRHLTDFADQRHSWLGSTLVAQYRAELLGDINYRRSKLEQYYAEGERNEEFLLELTAALGEAEQYDRVPQIVLQADRMTSGGVGWQLLAHCLQAYAAIENKSAFDDLLQRLRNMEAVPKDALGQLAATWEGEEAEA